jgi:predicted ATPase
VTLTGPGGCGKTRLALEVASDLIEDFTDGVWVVSLAPIGDPDLIIPTIGGVLGLRDGGERAPLERLRAYLAGKALLLLLDNFEHLVEGAPLVEELLARGLDAPRVKVLVTSREALHLSAEHEFPVPPLELPDPVRGGRSRTSLETLAKAPAVQLFVQRAQTIMPHFALTNENGAAVAEVCRRLDGLPLAIELATAWIKLLPPRAMLGRLQGAQGYSPLRLLTQGDRALPGRHWTLRSTIEWSHELLDEDEQRLFRRLCVFVGGCALEAAEAVCAEEILDAAASLIDKNLLIQVEQEDGEPRLILLETIREYGLERLVESGEEQSIRQAHAHYYLWLAEEAEPNLLGADQGLWLDRLEREDGNLRAGLRWLLETGDGAMAIRFGGSLWRFWLQRGYLGEGRKWLEEALAADGDAMMPARAKALNGAGVLAQYQGDYRQAALLCGESLRLARQLEDKDQIAAALNGLAAVARAGGNHKVACAMYEESLAIQRELGDRQGAAYSLGYLGLTRWMQGKYTEACPLLEEALAIFRELRDKRGIAFSLHGLGHVMLSQEDYEAAHAIFEESLAIGRSLGDKRGITRSLVGLASLALAREEYATARSLHQENLAILTELGDRWVTAICLDALAGVATAEGLPVKAARLFGAAAALRDAINAPLPPFERALHKRYFPAARTQLDAEAFAAAWAEGQMMTLEEAMAAARSADSELPAHPQRPTLGPKVGVGSRHLAPVRA